MHASKIIPKAEILHLVISTQDKFTMRVTMGIHIQINNQHVIKLSENVPCQPNMLDSNIDSYYCNIKIQFLYNIIIIGGENIVW